MFDFTIKYLGFLKTVHILAAGFEGMLRLYTFIFRKEILNYIDIIESDLSTFINIKITNHRYGGIQFNYLTKEIGHIHGNGLLDMLLDIQTKHLLMNDGRITDHHQFKNSGWISFYIRTEDDMKYALELLTKGYALRKAKLLGVAA